MLDFSIRPEFATHPYVNKLHGIIGFLGGDDRKRFGASDKARDIPEIWYLTGRCANAEVIPVLDKKLYRVKCQSTDTHSSMWTRPPDSNSAMPKPDDFVVATCRREHINVGPYAGSDLRNCSRVIIIDSYLVDYQIQEDNVGLIWQIDAMLIHKLDAWKKNCSDKG